MAYGSGKKKKITLGKNDYLKFNMDAKLREQHMHVIGATRSGKSRFLLSLIQQDLRNKAGLCVIDPHGELVDHIRDWLAQKEETTKRRTVHLLEARDLEYSFGFNPLHVDDDLYIDAVVGRAVDAVATASTGDGVEGQPLVLETLTDIFTALASARLTLAESHYLLSPNYPAEREAIVSTLKNTRVRQNWEQHNYMAVKAPRQYIEKFEAASRRISRMIGIEYTLYPIIGQSESVLDLKQAMDDGDIILLDLSQEGGYLPPGGADLIGRLMVSSLVGAAFRRTARTSRPFNLYIDEVHKYLTYNITTILDECAKFGLHLTFAHQRLTQLIGADGNKQLLDGVMGSAMNKICFKLGDPNDADIMQRRIFAGHYDLEKPKHSMDKPVVVGHEIIELQSRSASQSEATTEGVASAEAVSYMEGKGYTESSATSLSHSESTSLAHSRSKSLGTSDSQSSGQNSMNSSGAGASSGGGIANSSSMGSGTGAGSSMNTGGGVTIDQDGNPVATTDNMGAGESLSMMDTSGMGVAHSATHGTSHNSMHGAGESSGIAHGTSQSVTNAVTSSHTSSSGTTDTHGVAESFNTATGNTQSQGTSKGVMRGSTNSRGTSQTLAPILKTLPSTLYSLEELKHQFADGILNLPKRTAFATISGVGMVKIETLNTPDVIVSKSKKKRIMDGIKQNSPVHKTAKEARHEIEMRFQRFMEEHNPQMIERDPMNPTPEVEFIEPFSLPTEDPMNPDG